MPFDKTKFYTGVNIGWLHDDYGWDLSYRFDKANDPRTFTGIQFDKMINAYFGHLYFRHIKVVRMWLLEGLEGMGLSPSPPNYFQLTSSTTFEYIKWLDFQKRITIIMQKAQAYHLQIYWCLFDGAGLLPDNKPSLQYKMSFFHLVNSSRNNFIQDILDPFLKCINPFKEYVFAIDIVNEVDWIWEKKIMSRSTVVSFIRDIRDYIVGPLSSPAKYKCTASFHSYKGLTQEAGIAQNEKVEFLDFYDFHRYYDPDAKGDIDHGDLLEWKVDKFCIIGEAGHRFKPDVCIPLKKIYELQVSSSKELMEQALKQKYNGILLWRYTPVEKDIYKPHRLLKLTKLDKGNITTTVMSNFLTNFIAAAGNATSVDQNPFTNYNNPFADYERPIWNEVKAFVGTIAASRIP